ncbi:MAG TPA: RNA 2',3'-cyclic phosphodiesterase [Actinomycetota bacterium]|nr:RNA 2',3'-cyclic phosphodiesterase [Actinomycetota bacterium]
MTGEKLRLFTAVVVPEPQLTWLDEAVAELRPLPGARWAPVENQHVTLNFLGWVPAEDLERVVERVDAVAPLHRASNAALGGLGAFPRERRARVLWAGIDDPTGLLAGLAADLGDELRAVGYEPEERAYTPHLTLARFKTPRSLTGLLPALPPPPGTFPIDRVTLFRSRLSPSGSRYEVVHEAYLGADDGGVSQ